MQVVGRRGSPVEGVDLCDGSVQALGRFGAHQLEVEDNAVAGVLGDRQVNVFPRVRGHLKDWVNDPVRRRQRQIILGHPWRAREKDNWYFNGAFRLLI